MVEVSKIWLRKLAKPKIGCRQDRIELPELMKIIHFIKMYNLHQMRPDVIVVPFIIRNVYNINSIVFKFCMHLNTKYKLF